jgi:membrane protein implicated in regulation of membrane protease activity
MNPVSLAAVVVSLSEDITQAEDYNPGWGLFALIAFLVVAVVLLARSFRKQLRKADRHFAGREADREAGDGDGDRR